MIYCVYKFIDQYETIEIIVFYILLALLCSGEDVCRPDVTGLPRKGNISWPDTLAGSTRYKLCPYAYQKAVYANRQCVLQLTADDVTKSVWGPAAMSTCPDPPFSIGVEEMAVNVVSEIIFTSTHRERHG